uniref:F-specific orf protein n=1 Tax=Utterbackia peninsularis TaxID=872316 RepID=F4ZG87_9BIVA|nr:f-specific orf protein [Utterbackia peninsularis]
MLKLPFKLYLLASLIFTRFFFLSGSDHFLTMSQVLHSMDLNDASSQASTGDHPIIPSKASTDLTKPNTSA